MQPCRLAIPQNVKYGDTIRPSNFTPRYSPKRIKNTHPHKNLYVNFHHSIIHNSQKVETAQCVAVDEWLNKMEYICTMEDYSIIKSNEVLIYPCCNMDEPWKHAKWKNSHKRPHVIWFHLYEMLWVGKSIETERLVIARGWLQGDMGTALFLRQWNVLKWDYGDECTAPEYSKRALICTL